MLLSGSVVRVVQAMEAGEEELEAAIYQHMPMILCIIHGRWAVVVETQFMAREEEEEVNCGGGDW